MGDFGAIMAQLGALAAIAPSKIRHKVTGAIAYRGASAL